MTVLIAWIAALVAAGLMLGIVGYGLVGQLSRLRRALALAQSDVQPRTAELARHVAAGAPPGRHSAERSANTLR